MKEGGIAIKVFLKNKKLLIAVSAEILFYLLIIVWQWAGISVGRSLPRYVIEAFCELIGFLFVVRAFICNFNGKVQNAIICAAIALLIGLATSLCKGNILNVLFVLPQTMLLVFLLQGKRNIKVWVWIAWGTVFLPIIISLVSLMVLHISFADILQPLVMAICFLLPFGFVYYFGFADKHNAVFLRTATKPSTATSYLEEYKRNRLNGGK